MYPSCQPQLVWGNQQYSTVAQGPSGRSDGNLWGANVRRIMGKLQIVCGVIGFALGVAAICVPLGYFDYTDYVGWGLWNGIFSTVTGFLGVNSKKKKGVLLVSLLMKLTKTYIQSMIIWPVKYITSVISYMVTSIIASVMAAACCFYAVAGSSSSRYSYYYGSRGGNFAMYIIMCIVFSIQMVVSIIGASFTCGAVCSTKNQSQQIVYYYTQQAQAQQYGPAPPYAMAADQQFNAPQNIQPFQSTTPNNQPQQFVPTPAAPLVDAQQFNAPQSMQPFHVTTETSFGTSELSKNNKA